MVHARPPMPPNNHPALCALRCGRAVWSRVATRVQGTWTCTSLNRTVVLRSWVRTALKHGTPISHRTRYDENFVVHFETTTDAEPLIPHTEYQMVAKGDNTVAIPTALTTKFHDSLVGKNITGASVPDATLPTKMQYGTLNRPRQSWYSDRLAALKVF